jgi:hypothetical protein
MAKQTGEKLVAANRKAPVTLFGKLGLALPVGHGGESHPGRSPEPEGQLRLVQSGEAFCLAATSVILAEQGEPRSDPVPETCCTRGNP